MDNLDGGFFLDEFGTLQRIVDVDGQKLPQIVDTISDYESEMRSYYYDYQ